MMRRIVILSLFILILFTTSKSFGFRCNLELVSEGDTKLEILLKCGNPTFKEIVKTNGFIVEKWYYNCGAYRFIRILTFIDGTLQILEKGGYGTGPERCR